MTKNHLGGHYNFTAMLKPTYDLIQKQFNVTSMLDIGCGPGGMVEYSNYIGVYSVGIDGDESVKKDKDYILIHDYTLGELELNETFDLVYSTEFLEHVEEKYVSNFMPSFQKGKYVFCSAAPPGQSGYHHVNCKPKEYWIEKFNEYGFEYDEENTKKISDTSDDRVVKTNGMFFRNMNTIIVTNNRKPFIIAKDLIDDNTSSYLKKGGCYK
jgi:SAM-dependent methyltransferase